MAFEEAVEIAGAITLVPGGVGPILPNGEHAQGSSSAPETAYVRTPGKRSTTRNAEELALILAMPVFMITE